MRNVIECSIYCRVGLAMQVGMGQVIVYSSTLSFGLPTQERTGVTCRSFFGLWSSVFQRFNRWAKSGVWGQIYEAMKSPDLKALILDSTVIRVHQHSAGSLKKKRCISNEALDRSRGGFGSKLYTAVDAQGRPVEMLIGPGQEHDVIRVEELLGDHRPRQLIADKSYDSDLFFAMVKCHSAEVVIPPRRSRLQPHEYNRKAHKIRNLTERFSNRLNLSTSFHALRNEGSHRLAFVQFSAANICSLSLAADLAPFLKSFQFLGRMHRQYFNASRRKIKFSADGYSICC